MTVGHLLLDALTATVTDLAAGFLLAIAIATVVFVIRQERAQERKRRDEELRAVPTAEEVEPAFQFKLDPRPVAAKTDLAGKTRVGVDRPGSAR